MARRPTAPRPRPGTRRAAPTSAPAPQDPAPRRGAPVGRARPAPAPSEPAAAGPDPGEDGGGGGGRVVQAAGRFRELVAGRPWRRRRRAILATVAATVLVLVAGLAAAVFLPALQVQQVTVSGLDYVEEGDVQAAIEPHRGDSVLLLPSSDIAADVAEVPGVRDAKVERAWPDGVRVSVTEATPVGTLTRTDGSTAVIDAQGRELPEAASEAAGSELVPLTADGGAADPEGAAAAMSEVLASMPESLRGSVEKMTATSASDVRFVLSLEDGGTRTVVWGDAADAELKGKVVQALVAEPGTEIDVSSPVAPVTR
ncbi:cell division protein FtsQ/DivIB [Brachybacterium sacelli]|uniref:Cell division protein FtsQ n=1 Tax=Brachybacterium sacelli TaxID=173364 RepID=A0ABS4X161_9MICO|nr:FtsQ-type POTRA domain-containing protein [Brachybacterium sacelli]MBP2382198.1 cell division protein FtsQ [Brachybacterium sacelli]